MDKEIENAMYDYIVATNNEENLCNDIRDERLHRKLRAYFGLNDEGVEE